MNRRNSRISAGRHVSGCGGGLTRTYSARAMSSPGSRTTRCGSASTCRWCCQEDRRAQLAHLAAMSRRPGVDLRMLRFAGGPHPGMSSVINIFDFPDDEEVEDVDHAAHARMRAAREP